MILNEFAKEVHANAREHGWWDTDRDNAEVIALIHSEWSEALEEYRAGRPMVWHACDEAPDGVVGVCNPADEFDCRNYGHEDECKYRNHKPEGIAVELLDGCIRIFDYIGRQGKIIRGFDTLEELMSISPEAACKVSLPRLVANMHLKTSQAYTMLQQSGAAPEFVQRGCATLFEAVGVTCAWIKEQGLDPEAIMLQKHEYNKSRPYKHGGKVC